MMRPDEPEKMLEPVHSISVDANRKARRAREAELRKRNEDLSKENEKLKRELLVSRKTMKDFRDFVLNAVCKWSDLHVDPSHHNPIWQKVADEIEKGK